MRKIVIICDAYGQQNYALQLAIQDYRDCSVTIVIPSSYNLLEFFKVVNDKVFHNAINLVYLEPFQPRRAKASGIKKILYVIPDIIRERHYLKVTFAKYFAELRGCEVFFFSRGFSGITFYLLKKLIKRNKLVYVSVASFAPSHWSEYTPTNITELTSLVLSRLVYGREITLGQFPHYKGFPFMPDKFIEKEVNRVMERAEIEEMMNGFDSSPFRVFDADNYRAIYFEQPLVGVGYISDGDTYNQELTRVLNILGKYFPQEEIAIKYHPGYDGDENLANMGSIIPSFIPAELLYSDKVKIYLAVFSRSIANVEKGLVVSLLDLITFKSDEIRDMLKDDLIQASKSTILFPKSLDEFERILIESSKLK